MSGIIERLVELLRDVPPELSTILLAMLPIGELRGALPVAILVYKFSLIKAVMLSVIGNMLPIYFLLLFFEGVANYASRKSQKMEKMLNAVYDRTRRKLDARVKVYGYWALTLFVAIPLPVTGAWTGAIAAFVFGFSRKKAFLAIFIGVLISSQIVTLVTLGGLAIIKNLLQ